MRACKRRLAGALEKCLGGAGRNRRADVLLERLIARRASSENVTFECARRKAPRVSRSKTVRMPFGYEPWQRD